jgi:plasmid stabilization system protein ParE
VNVRFVLAPEAALDLVKIWRYIKKKVSVEMADRVEAVIREKIVFLAETRRRALAQGFDGGVCEVFPGLFLPYCLSPRE